MGKTEQSTQVLRGPNTKYCHDCGCKEGQLHNLGCDMERCAFCGGQLISCECCYTLLGFDYKGRTNDHPTCGLPPEIYAGGLPSNLQEKWEAVLEEKGRVPYMLYPVMCCRCAQLWPEFFKVPTEEWKRYVQKDRRHKVLCRPCYDHIKHLIDTNGG